MATPDARDPTAAIRAVLDPHQDVLLAMLFGSAVDGRLAPGSDVDVAVLGTHPLDVDDRMALVRDLGRATGRAVDLVDLSVAGVPLLQQILGSGREVFCRDRDAKHRLIIRMLNDVEDFLPLRRRALKERRERWLETS